VAVRCNASQDAQDAWDAENTSLASGRNADGSDAGSVFADVWALMKSRIQTRRGHERITSLPQMRLVLQEEWDRVTIEDINKVVARLPSIIAKCILVNGGNNYHA